MDLIYADNNGIELGFLPSCELDLAFGKDENTFECVLDIDNHCCESGYMIYATGTEYGGTVDAIAPDTDKKTVTYTGRTWHGMLEKKIICPDAGQNYYYVSGEANTVLAELITRLGLSALFEVSTEESGIEIVNYRFERYVRGYTGIRKMLYAHRAKLKIVSASKKVIISAEPLLDYSQNDEFDGSLLKMSVKKTYRPPNHLVCLGGGDLAARKVIHLFTDENGIIQSYANTDTPYSDADYILNTSKQVLFDTDEVTEIYDYSSAPITENYLYLLSQPADWRKNITSYYSMTEDGVFKALEAWTEDVYQLLSSKPTDWDINYDGYYEVVDGEFVTAQDGDEKLYSLLSSQPSDWATNYDDYYYYDGEKYKTVESKTEYYYTEQTSQPLNWETEYKNYYYKFNDGTTEAGTYKQVSGREIEKYLLQIVKPSNWDVNCKSYYYIKQYYAYYYKETTTSGSGNMKKVVTKTAVYEKSMPTGKISKTLTRKFVKKVLRYEGYESVPEGKKWAKNKYYTKGTDYVAPPWKAGTFYTQSTSEVTPAWNANTYYEQYVNLIPTWTDGKYYKKVEIVKYPTFYPYTYFEKRIDNFAGLVEKGIEKLTSLSNADKLSINFAPDENYDIGDIVGATESVTGISVSQPITKKIVTLKDNQETIKYEIGE